MSTASAARGEGLSRRGRVQPGWLLAVGAMALVVLVAARFGLTNWWATVQTPDGPAMLPVTFAGVDHPFHLARTETLLRSLQSGSLLRWVGQHQGGYPIEFYPPGVAWFETGLWAVFLGQIPLEIVHKFAIALIFLAPGLAWWWIARRDGRTGAAALLALALQVAIPGGPYHGGYTELVQWGLVTNVAGALCALVMLAALSDWLVSGARLSGVIASFAAAAAVYANPRSMFALIVVGVAALLAAIWPDASNARPSPARVVGRLAVVAVVASCLSAPELIALLRFNHLYSFVNYSGYATWRDWWQASLDAVSSPVWLLAIAGMAVAFLSPGQPRTRAVAIALPLYSGLTLAATTSLGAVVPQLEATRLMPFQRLLALYLAAWLVVTAVETLAKRAPGRAWLSAGATVAVAALVVAWWLRPGPAGMPNPAIMTPAERGLYPVITTADPVQADFRSAVLAADAATGPGNAMLIVGSQLSWHQPLWAPFWTGRPLFYDNWLWFWQFDQPGPPDFVASRGNNYPTPALTLTRDFLDLHGVGTVVVSGAERQVAASSRFLVPVRAGTAYDVYQVRNPAGLAQTDGVTDESIYANGDIMTTTANAGTLTVAQNWFPRWRATVNGQPAVIERAPNGFLQVPGISAGARVELVYGLDGWDWLARGLVVIGPGAIAFGWVWFGRGTGMRAGAAEIGAGTDAARTI